MEENKEEIKKKNMIIVILSIVIVALIATCVYVLFIKKPSDSTKNDNGKELENTSENNSVESEDLEFKTADGKYTLKLLANGYVYLNDKRIVDYHDESGNPEREEEGKYVTIGGDFDPSPEYIDRLFFVLDKDTKLIVEKPDLELTDECGYSSYGEYTRFCNRCNGFSVRVINNWYFFEITQEMGPSEIYTTNWKKLGWISEISDDVKYDDKGIYVCSEDYASYEGKNCISDGGKEIKYDVNGNILTD